MNRRERRVGTGLRRASREPAAREAAVADLFGAGVKHHQAGRLEEAETCYRQVLAAQPDHAGALHLFGVVAHQAGRHELAVDLIGRAIMRNSTNPIYFSNLGCALRDLGRRDEAAAAFEQAIRVKPDFAQAYLSLGVALKDQGKLDEAVAAYRRAHQIKPDLVEACFNLGNTLKGMCRLDEAVAAYRHAIRIQPSLLQAHCNLGNALCDQGKLDEAVAAFGQAIRIKPDYATAHSNLGAALFEQGKLDDAVAACREAIRLKPDFSDASSNLAFCLNNVDNISVGELFETHKEWNARHGRALPRPDAHDNDRSVGRRLKIGYVSPDFRGHSVAYFLEPLLQSHDRNAVEVLCYAEVSWPDVATRRFEQLADHWTKTVGMSDEALAERIRCDGIDILVDLAGHTAKNRLPVFARKPAPVQVTWLGYPNTTGLKAMDYRLVDAVTDPEREADAFASETLVRLPGGFLCYGARNDAPVTATPPCLSS
jgi:protein O-GlcNAc transferase